MRTRELTTGQYTVLRIVSRRDPDKDGAISTAEIGDIVGYSVDSRMKTLEKRGFLEQLGRTLTGSWCWHITPAGRAALHSARETMKGQEA